MIDILADPQPKASTGFVRPATLDRIVDDAERLLLLALYVWLGVRLVHGYQTDGRALNLLLLPSEGLVIFFMMIRRRAIRISRHPGEWLVAIVATCAPMLVVSGSQVPLIPPMIGSTLMMIGFLLQLHAKISLGRSFGVVPANRGIKLSGPYRFIRHPMYSGYLLGHLGFLSMNASLWNLAVYTFCYATQAVRLMAEERLLSVDPLYREYRTRVRYWLIPGLF